MKAKIGLAITSSLLVVAMTGCDQQSNSGGDGSSAGASGKADGFGEPCEDTKLAIAACLGEETAPDIACEELEWLDATDDCETLLEGAGYSDPATWPDEPGADEDPYGDEEDKQFEYFVCTGDMFAVGVNCVGIAHQVILAAIGAATWEDVARTVAGQGSACIDASFKLWNCVVNHYPRSDRRWGAFRDACIADNNGSSDMPPAGDQACYQQFGL